MRGGRGGKGKGSAGKGSKGSKGGKGGKGDEEGSGSGRGLSQSEVPEDTEEEQQQLELRNDRGETSSQQSRRVLRELNDDVTEEVNGERAPEVARDALTIAQLRRAAQGNPEPRNGTGGEFPFKCFGPGCSKRFISKNSLCHHFYTSNVCCVSLNRIKWTRIRHKV